MPRIYGTPTNCGARTRAGHNLPAPRAGIAKPAPQAGHSIPAPVAGIYKPAPQAGHSIPAPHAGPRIRFAGRA